MMTLKRQRVTATTLGQQTLAEGTVAQYLPHEPLQSTQLPQRSELGLQVPNQRLVRRC